MAASHNTHLQLRAGDTQVAGKHLQEEHSAGGEGHAWGQARGGRWRHTGLLTASWLERSVGRDEHVWGHARVSWVVARRQLHKSSPWSPAPPPCANPHAVFDALISGRSQDEEGVQGPHRWPQTSRPPSQQRHTLCSRPACVWGQRVRGVGFG